VQEGNHMRFIYIIGIVLSLLAGKPSFSQDVSVTAKLDTGTMLIGDHVGLKLQFKGPSSLQVIWPVFNDTILEKIIVIGRAKIDTSFSKDKKDLTLTQELNLTCFDTGAYAFPQIPFRYRILPDTAVRTVSAGLRMLIVHTVKVDTSNVIKPIKGPLGIPITFREMLPYILAAIALAALIILLIWYLKKRKKHEPLITIRQKAKLQPHEKALQDLEKLRIRKLWQEGHIKEYHSELTDIIRTYIEQGFRIPAMESTTHEIIGQLGERSDFSKPLIQKVEHILRIADMVKFAKAIPVPQENENALNSGIEFINETTRPVFEKPRAEESNELGKQSQS